jgi:hypothetical protein
MIHSLFARPPNWSLVKGIQGSGPIILENIDFLCNYPKFQQRIQALYNQSHQDDAQIKIDSHVPAAACVLYDTTCSWAMVQKIIYCSDAPQLATMPDIGNVIRQCIIYQRWHYTLLGGFDFLFLLFVFVFLH